MNRDSDWTLPRFSFRRAFCWLIASLALLLLTGLWFVQPAQAQDVTTTPAVATANQDEINGVARQLWCPLCSGVRLDACELKACDQMKVVIGQKLSAGEDVQSIKNYFLAQYGPQVLGEPPLEGFNWLAWLLPVAVLIGGGIFVWSRARGMMRKPQPAGTAPDSPAAGATAGDDYSQKLEEELKHYD